MSNNVGHTSSSCCELLYFPYVLFVIQAMFVQIYFHSFAPIIRLPLHDALSTNFKNLDIRRLLRNTYFRVKGQHLDVIDVLHSSRLSVNVSLKLIEIPVGPPSDQAVT